jgi:hypothetical protein
MVIFTTTAKSGRKKTVLLQHIQHPAADCPCEKRHFAPFISKNDHFAKTGSGQTQGKLKKDAVFRTDPRLA